MNTLPKLLMGLGVALVVFGGVLLVAQRFGIRRLPGDFTWEGKHGTLHFPLATSLILSVVLTLLINLWLARR